MSRGIMNANNTYVRVLVFSQWSVKLTKDGNFLFLSFFFLIFQLYYFWKNESTIDFFLLLKQGQ